MKRGKGMFLVVVWSGRGKGKYFVGEGQKVGRGKWKRGCAGAAWEGGMQGVEGGCDGQ